MDTKPNLVIMFDRGAVSGLTIAQSLAQDFDLIFTIPRLPYPLQLRPILAELGQIVQLTGDFAADSTQLARHHPDGIVTFSESLLVSTARLAHLLGLPYHEPRTANVLTDKIEQRLALRESGVDRVMTAVIDSADAWPRALSEVGLPAIVKPVHGSGSTDVYLIRDEAEASRVRAALLDRPGDSPYLLAEEYLQGRPSFPFGDYVSVESVCGPQGITHVAVTGKFPLRPPFAEQGSFWPAHLPAHEITEVTELVGRALIALGVSIGVTHTEVQLTADGPRIIEVNGRLGGQIHDIALRSNSIDLVKTNALLAIGEPVSVKQVETDRVHFMNVLLAPVRPCVLTAVHGIRSARRIPGITGYTSVARPGEHLPGGVGSRRVGLLYGEAPDHDTMIALVNQARSALTFEFSYQ